jgi:DNA mismatch repair protein MutH
MYPDFKELLSTLNAHKVKYLIVGGYAVGFHAQPRATKDLDIFIRPDAGNAKAVHDALAAFGAPLKDVRPRIFLIRMAFFELAMRQ